MAGKGLRETLVSHLECNTLNRNLILKPTRDFNIQQTYKSLVKLKEVSTDEIDHWKKRIHKAQISSDNIKIKKVVGAGSLQKGFPRMHNGLVIDPLSYYRAPMLRLLMENASVHEPQEKYVFQEVLKCMKPRATMLQLGCYRGFYSMWFASTVQNPKNYLIDNIDRITRAKANFKLNKLNAHFIEGYTGNGSASPEITITNVDRICQENGIKFLDILRVDIQGAEHEMLGTMPEMVANRNIGFIFISSHSQELHYGCISWLESNGYKILYHSVIGKSFSEDDFIVAKDPNYIGPESFNISQFEEKRYKS